MTVFSILVLSQAFGGARRTMKTIIIAAIYFGLAGLVVESAPSVAIFRQANAVRVCWPSTDGGRYQLQRAASLRSDLWTNVGPDQQGSGEVICVDDAIAGDSRFYRLIVVPTQRRDPVFFEPTPLLSWIPGTNGSFTAKVRVRGDDIELALSEVNILMPNPQWFVDNGNWVDEMEDIVDELRCYRGTVVGEEGTTTLVTVGYGKIAGMLLPSSADLSSASATGFPTPAALPVASPTLAPNFATASSAGCFPTVELALEADVQFFQRFGDNSLLDTAMVMVNSANLLDFVFQREVGIRYRISFLGIWTREEDPYWSLNTKDLVNGMAEWWNDFRLWVRRDSAHLLSGKDMDKHGATRQLDDDEYPGLICNLGLAYSVSSDNADSHPPNLYSQYFHLLSNLLHEQGHQWSSGHCSGPDCRIMCGGEGCSINQFEFEPLTRQSIWNHLGSRLCLHCPSVQRRTSDPDLIIEDIELPSMGLGQTHQVGVRLMNVGGGPARTTVKLFTWLTLDGDPFSGFDDIQMGGPGLNSLLPGVSISLNPGEAQTYYFDTYPVPTYAVVGNQRFVAFVDFGAFPCGSLCEYNEDNNMKSRSVFVHGVDASVVAISAPDSAQSGLLVPIDVTVRNNSLQSLDVPVGVSLGINFASEMVRVPAQSQRTNQFWLIVPPSPFDCGGPAPFTIRACANLQFDTFRANDCRDRGIDLIEDYWDLKIEIVSAPSAAARRSRVNWTVRWTNVGNGLSDSVCMRTGIANWSGDAYAWNSGFIFNNCGFGPIQTYTVPRLSAGQSHEHTFSMCIHPLAQTRRQYLKVGIDRVRGCFDNCQSGANFDQQSVQIY